MSRTTALGISPDRRPIELAELRNAFGWAPSIWDRLLACHGEGPWFRDDAGLNRLWQEIETLPEWQQAPLVLTFDTGIIPWQAYEWAADALDEFERRCPAPEGHANHVPAMADLLRSKPEAPAFGVYGTSVSDNPFDPRTYHDDDAEGCDNWNRYCNGHGSGLPLDALYILERHRHLLGLGDTEREDDPLGLVEVAVISGRADQ